MESYQWIHPIVALLTLGLLSATALSKMRRRKYFRLHYALALSTVVAVFITLGLGVATVARVFDECDCTDALPAILFVHLPLALLLFIFIFAQAVMGISMILVGRKRRLLRTHRFNARIVLSLAAVVLLAGVTTVAFLLI